MLREGKKQSKSYHNEKVVVGLQGENHRAGLLSRKAVGRGLPIGTGRAGALQAHGDYA